MSQRFIKGLILLAPRAGVPLTLYINGLDYPKFHKPLKSPSIPQRQFEKLPNSMGGWSRIVAVVLMALVCPAQAQTITGLPTVIDGDTLAIGVERVRLQGIDAPELDQTCGVWLCGRAARDELRRHIGLGQITCVPDGKDVYGRWLATCSTAVGDSLRDGDEGWTVPALAAFAQMSESSFRARFVKSGLVKLARFVGTDFGSFDVVKSLISDMIAGCDDTRPRRQRRRRR